MYRAVLPMSLAIMWFSRLSASTGCTPNVYVPGLQYAAGLVGYVHQQLGVPIASTAKRCTAALNRSLILAMGAVEAIGNPNCWWTYPTRPAAYCSPGT